MTDETPVIVGGDLDEERSERVTAKTLPEQLDAAENGPGFAQVINDFFTYLESIKDDG